MKGSYGVAKEVGYEFFLDPVARCRIENVTIYMTW